MKDKEITYDLKCVVCRKICGSITFSPESTVDLNELYLKHLTLCDEHQLKEK
jgi:hypothetical protein